MMCHYFWCCVSANADVYYMVFLGNGKRSGPESQEVMEQNVLDDGSYFLDRLLAATEDRYPLYDPAMTPWKDTYNKNKHNSASSTLTDTDNQDMFGEPLMPASETRQFHEQDKTQLDIQIRQYLRQLVSVKEDKKV